MSSSTADLKATTPPCKRTGPGVSEGQPRRVAAWFNQVGQDETGTATRLVKTSQPEAGDRLRWGGPVNVVAALVRRRSWFGARRGAQPLLLRRLRGFGVAVHAPRSAKLSAGPRAHCWRLGRFTGGSRGPRCVRAPSDGSAALASRSNPRASTSLRFSCRVSTSLGSFRTGFFSCRVRTRATKLRRRRTNPCSRPVCTGVAHWWWR